MINFKQIFFKEILLRHQLSDLFSRASLKRICFGHLRPLQLKYQK